MNELLIVIPAVKKNVAFPDDLVKKLAGVPLIQRTLAIATAMVSKDQVLVVTDSKEIELICERQGVMSLCDPALRLPSDSTVLLVLVEYLRGHTGKWKDLLMLSSYVPLLREETLKSAYEQYCRNGAEFMVPVVRLKSRPYSPWPKSLQDWFLSGSRQESTIESTAFYIVSRSLLGDKSGREIQPVAFPLDEHLIEIHSYHDWWLCEKLINRRRIVFRVIGNEAVGMGHIFHCLALAHEISDHEVYFVCDKESRVATNKLAGYDYWLGVYEHEAIEQAIIDLKPDIVVNDILDTDACYIHFLRKHGIRVVNFEDLGSGAAEADLTINDLYDEPLLPGDRIVWGHGWFFLRDEFNDARPQRFQKKVGRLLITFGGTDPSDYTRRVLILVAPYCAKHGIAIDVVTGDGYSHMEDLEALIARLPGEVVYSHATGIISRIMEEAQFAICSNGRTVYELAHMNIPALVLSHHAREKSHRFACEDNGFFPVDIPNGPEHDPMILKALQRLVEDTDYRHQLFNNMKDHGFVENKHKIVERLQSLLGQKR